MSRILSICALLLISASLGPLPAAAQEGLFVRPLSQPLAGQPFELFFAGYWINYFDPPTPQPVVTVDENVISVRVDAFAFPILPPVSSYAFGAPVDGLPAGDYEVRLQLAEGSQPQATYAITVREPRLEVEVLEAPRLAGETARILIRGLTRCPEWPEGPVVDGSVIYLPEATDCVADPPRFFERTFTTPPLEAGEYDVYAVQADQEGGYSPDDALGFAKLRVDPRPMLQNGRFAVDVAWQDFQGKTGVGRPVASPTDQSALLWFFGPNNWEMMVKILDGCSINDHYWVYSAASTNVGYDLTITDSVVGGDWSYSNALGTRSPAQADVEAFPCATEASSADLGKTGQPALPRDTRVESATSQATTSKAFGFDWVGPIAFEPALPSDSRPTTLHLVGSWPTNGQPLPAVDSVRIDTADQRVVVALSGPPTGCVLSPPFLCTPGHDYALSVDLGRLNAGSWELEVVHADPDAGETPLSIWDFHVSGGFEIVAPEHPVTDLEPVELLVRGVASCPSLSIEAIEEGRIDLRVIHCPIGVPPPPREFELPISLDLGPGSYRVVLRGPFGGDEIANETHLEVVGLPVPLGTDGRYIASVTWTDFKGVQGIGRPAVKPSEDSALFWFFGPDNWELMVKVLEACDLNGHVWVYGAASTNVAYELRVVDTVTGAEWTFENPLGQRSDAITDVEAFVCD